MKLAKLHTTRADSAPVWIDLSAVVVIEPGTAVGTAISLTSGRTVEVSESPEEVAGMVE